MKEKNKITVAVDGYSSTGKSTMARTLARRAGYAYVDTGAMYRAVTLYGLRHGMIEGDKVDEAALVAALDQIHITFKAGEGGANVTCLNGEEVEGEIRGMAVSNAVSPVAAISAVRAAMVKQQQAMGRDKGVVMDGRDIGTVVFPDAELKVFVTASVDVRTMRRYKELVAKGTADVNLDEVRHNLEERDRIDTTRADSPLRRADDAVELDNSYLTVAEQDDILYALFCQREREAQ